MEVFNITLPTSWAELSDKQLHMVYSLFARDLSAAEVKTLCQFVPTAVSLKSALLSHSWSTAFGKTSVQAKKYPGITDGAARTMQSLLMHCRVVTDVG